MNFVFRLSTEKVEHALDKLTKVIFEIVTENPPKRKRAQQKIETDSKKLKIIQCILEIYCQQLRHT